MNASPKTERTFPSQIAGSCALCHTHAELRRSHIFSEFFYSSVYDETHRFLQTSTNSADQVLLRQKGLREKLLCQRCETKLSVWETYGRSVIYGGKELHYEQDRNSVTIQGIDYANFKLFQLSLLWRASVSKRSEFAAVQLGPYEERIRKHLLSSDPGKFYEYGCLLAYPPEQRAREIFRQVVIPPDMIKAKGHHLFRFLLGSLFWVYFISNHMKDLTEEKLSLHEDGTLRIYSGGPPLMLYLHRFARDLCAANAVRKPILQKI